MYRLEGHHHIRLLCRDNTTRQIIFVLDTTSDQERDAWFNAMALAIETVIPSTNNEQGHVIQLTTFHQITYCFQCQKRFKANFFQGYRCLRCLANLHKNCLADYTCLETDTSNIIQNFNIINQCQPKHKLSI